MCHALYSAFCRFWIHLSTSDTSAQTHSTRTPSIQTYATTPPLSPKVPDIFEDQFCFLDEVVKAEAASHKDVDGLYCRPIHVCDGCVQGGV
jgi:hypothetical protein